MRILSLKPGHDGGIAYVEDDRLVMSLEAEKGSFPRNSSVTAQLMIEAMRLVPSMPDVLAVGGWHKYIPGLYTHIGAGYDGIQAGRAEAGHLFGSPVTLFTSTHERSHIMMAAGMHPSAPLQECTVLVWEGTLGAFYEWRQFGREIRKHEVMSHPGAKYGALFALADPSFDESLRYPRLEDAGKLMALAAYGNADETTKEMRSAVERILRLNEVYPFRKPDFRGTPLHNCGLDDAEFRNAAAYITMRIFDVFHGKARELGLRGPLVISGGCGLNCEWNERWRRSGLFGDVFVPPCANDSGSAIGTAIDARFHFASEARLQWSVYAGGEFVVDVVPDPGEWSRLPLDLEEVARRLRVGDIVAWVQGRYEMGPRALGNRSLLASATAASMRDRLNRLKGRESYRPIAPCCRTEDLGKWFDCTNPDPYMLFFSRVLTPRLPAVTHVDGSARVQAVHEHGNRRLHDLLGAFEAQTGIGVLCNTSLNFPGSGFINLMTELESFCRTRGISVFVVNEEMFVRAPTAEDRSHRDG